MNAQVGPLALLGSGEYLDVMNELDLLLLEMVGGIARAKVALIPAASGLEPGSPDRWNDLGRRHFELLGAKVTALSLITREDGDREEVVRVLREADLVYFSGGSPPYLIDTMQGTAAWEAIVARHTQGAGIAGCSAGAIMLGDHTFNHRAVMAGEPPVWRRAMGMVAGVAVLAHFDRFSRRWGRETLKGLLDTAPPQTTVLGIDEDTALVRVPAQSGQAWKVTGTQSVTVFAVSGEVSVFKTGEIVPLDDFLAEPAGP
jgi:cyanophycinase